MKSGEVIRVRTNSELLNELLGKNYARWMKSVYDFGDKRIWMIHIDNKPRNGWKNYKKGDVIVEENMRPNDTAGLRTDVRHNTERIVFSKHDSYFIFEGQYKYDKEKSKDSGIRYWVRVSDQF
jgi:hypothetical protein